MAIIDRLKAFGLGQRQAELYLALLRRGPSSAIQLAKDIRAKHPTVYSALETLKDKGLVSESLGAAGRRVFTAEDPERIRRAEDERRHRLNELLPDLQTLFRAGGKRPRARLYSGEERTEVLHGELLGVESKEYFYFGNAREMLEHGGEERLREYYRRRIERGVWSNAIRVRSPEDDIEYMRGGKRHLRRLRFLPAPVFDGVAELYLYDGRVAVTGGLHEDYLMIIESRELWMLLMTVWRLVWERAEPPAKTASLRFARVPVPEKTEVTGDTLRCYRKAHGMTRDDLAKKLEVTKETVSQWERGSRPIPATVRFAMEVLC